MSELIDRCLQQAGVAADSIRAVKVHAVGGAGDSGEQAVLREKLPENRWILAKPYFGHTLGASGAMESAWLWQQLQQGALPEIPHAAAYRSLPLAHGAPLADGLYLNYFLGFGGSAAAWLMRWSRP